jgi:hypothetical protein
MRMLGTLVLVDSLEILSHESSSTLYYYFVLLVSHVYFIIHNNAPHMQKPKCETKSCKRIQRGISRELNAPSQHIKCLAGQGDETGLEVVSCRKGSKKGRERRVNAKPLRMHAMWEYSSREERELRRGNL